MTKSMQDVVEPMILAYLAGRPQGAEVMEIVRDLKITIHTARKYLGLMHKTKSVLWVGTPGRGVWSMAENKDKAVAHLAVINEEVRLSRLKRENERKRKSRKKLTPELIKARIEKMNAEIDAWAEKPANRRWIPATEAAPIKKAGPASVWELAA